MSKSSGHSHASKEDGIVPRWPRDHFCETRNTSHNKQPTVPIPSLKITRPSNAGTSKADIPAKPEHHEFTHQTRLEGVHIPDRSFRVTDHSEPKQTTASSIKQRADRYEGGNQTAADSSRDREPVPPGRLLSPPPWLKQPRKQPSDAFTQLRHVKTKSHDDFSHVETHVWESRQGPDPSNDIDRFDPSHNQYVRASVLKNGISRPAVPSPPTALHVTHHQKQELWMDPHADLHSKSEATREAPYQTLPDAPSTSTPATASAQPRDHTDAHHHHSLIPPASHLLRKSLESLRQQAESALRKRAKHVHGLVNAEHEDLPAAGVPDVELCRPDPVVPAVANDSHTCRWRERYLDLTTEVRTLKAEMSSQAESARAAEAQAEMEGREPINDDDDLRLEGLTIIMRRRGRRDVVIETDLTQDCEGSV